MIRSVQDVVDYIQKHHAGQTDGQGKPYWKHPYRVAVIYQNNYPNDETYDGIFAAMCHDIIEDTDQTAQEMLDFGFSEATVEAVKLLSHKSDCDYLEYIQGLIDSGNKIALRVKLCDLTDNTDIRRGKLTKKAPTYYTAIKMIEESELI